MKIRIVLIILIVGLCVAFVAEFWMNVDEERRIAEACVEANAGPIKFSCDWVPQHPVALLHSLAFVLLIAAVFARKYYWALGVAVAYAGLDVLGTYARLGTGFFGGNMCPEGHPCWAAIRRATWFDWTALTILMISIVLIAWKALHKRQEGLA